MTSKTPLCREIRTPPPPQKNRFQSPFLCKKPQKKGEIALISPCRLYKTSLLFLCLQITFSAKNLGLLLFAFFFFRDALYRYVHSVFDDFNFFLVGHFNDGCGGFEAKSVRKRRFRV